MPSMTDHNKQLKKSNNLRHFYVHQIVQKLFCMLKNQNMLKTSQNRGVDKTVKLVDWLSARKKFKGGGKRQWTIAFQNSRLLFLLFFLLFLKILGGKSRFFPGAPTCSSIKPG